jgi:hypothetical protein
MDNYWQSYRFENSRRGIETMNLILNLVGEPDESFMYTVLENGTHDLLIYCDDELKRAIEEYTVMDANGFITLDVDGLAELVGVL